MIDFSKQPKSILITGCSSGIGLATALFLQKNGWQVFATVRKNQDIATLKTAGLQHVFLLDLRDSASIQTAVKQVLQVTGGQLSVLCNNAAYGLPAALEDVSRQALSVQFETNLFGTHELTRAILPVMRQQQYGRIVQISSVLGLVSMPLRGAYNASKYALEGLSDTLRMELHSSGIKVILVEPGPIESAFRQNAQQAFEDWVDMENSVFKQTYREMIEQRIVKQTKMPFTLPAENVARLIYRAITVKKPKARYYITIHTHLFGILRRVLSTKRLDSLIIKFAMTTPKNS